QVRGRDQRVSAASEDSFLSRPPKISPPVAIVLGIVCIPLGFLLKGSIGGALVGGGLGGPLGGSLGLRPPAVRGVATLARVSAAGRGRRGRRRTGSSIGCPPRSSGSG